MNLGGETDFYVTFSEYLSNHLIFVFHNTWAEATIGCSLKISFDLKGQVYTPGRIFQDLKMKEEDKPAPL